MRIYKITNIINQKLYIGQTITSLQERWRQHYNSKYCRLLHRAIEKYGKENFTIEEICSCSSIEEMNDLEIYYISYFKSLAPNGYNLLAGGSNKRHHEETKRKMSESRKGIKMTGKAASGVKRGKRPESVGINISKAKKGKSNGLKGIKKPFYSKPSQWRSVIGTNIQSGESTTYPSLNIAAQITGTQRPNINKVLSGKRNSAGGYFWKYVI